MDAAKMLTGAKGFLFFVLFLYPFIIVCKVLGGNGLHFSPFGFPLSEHTERTFVYFITNKRNVNIL